MTDRPRLATSTIGSGLTGWDDALWYKDAVIYELHVRAFCDSNGDGVGDFPGLITKLDYLQELGVTALWLLPFYPSPLRDDGYDIADYTSVHPAYGTTDDFRRFLDAAHGRGLRVITELVINHTSDQHPWFQRARTAEPGSLERDFYVWSDTPDKYEDVRIIFQDTETSNWAWDPVARQYYWHRFFSHQPDLNYDNPAVRTAVMGALDFWLELGVDGLRLDAIPYLHEREGTNGENLPETHYELKRLRRHVDERYAHRMFLAEANQWPEDTAAYFGDGDECHMAFHFPLMPRLFMSIQRENRFPVVDILEQTPSIPPTAQWAIFLRNHDELTLEMVTEEERDLMYQAYAEDPEARLNLGIRRRLAPLMGNDRRKIELMNVLLFSLPGTPVLYYGDEIGMGDNIYLGDRDGVRTPMQWTPGRNAGFSTANPQRLYLPAIIDPEYHYESINVEEQQGNLNSLLRWTMRMLALRRRHPVFGRGSIEFLQPDNPRVMAFLRDDGSHTVLVVANLSRHSQHVEIDLANRAGSAVIEMFGRSTFPPLGDRPYPLTLGPYGFFWLSLEPVPDDEIVAGPLPELEVGDSLIALTGRDTALASVLSRHVTQRSWYFRRFEPVLATEVSSIADFPEENWLLAVLRVDYAEGSPAEYLMPLATLWDVQPGSPEVPEEGIVALLRRGDQTGILIDAAWYPAAQQSLLETGRGSGAGQHQGIRWVEYGEGPLEAPEPVSVEDSPEGHTLVMYGARHVLKLFRRIEQGVNPDLEMRAFLTGSTEFTGVPRVLRAFEIIRSPSPAAIAIVEPHIPNEGTAWDHTIDSLRRFYDTVGTLPPAESETSLVPVRPITELMDRHPDQPIADLVAQDTAAARLLGRTTADLHLALASDAIDPAFRPEPITTLYQRSLYQSLRSEVRQILRTARRRDLPPDLRQSVDELLDQEALLMRCLARVSESKTSGVRIRCHGDYRLDEILFTGNEYVILDFTGDSTRPLSERRIKASPVRDIAEMIRSYDYATRRALQTEIDAGAISDEAVGTYMPWGRAWFRWVAAAFLGSYLDRSAGRLLPANPARLQALLDAYVLEKASRELLWEIDHRMDWVDVPLSALLDIVTWERQRSDG